MSNRKEQMSMYAYRGIDPAFMSKLRFAENQLGSYATGFDKIAAWIDGSLEMFRPELNQVLYPLFVYTYLETVRQQQGMRAREMMRKHQARFVEGEQGSVSITKEMADLSSVVYPQHLQNPVPKALLAGETAVKISRSSLELLFHFVQRNELWSILSVCNEHLRFDVQHQIVQDVRPPEGLLVKDTGDESLRVNRTEAPLDLLRGCLEDVLVERVLGSASQVSEDTRDGPQSDARRGDDALVTAAAMLRNRRMTATVPLKPWPEAMQEDAIAQLRSCVPLTGGQSPSCCMFTFPQTSQTLSCIAVDSAVANVAAGSSDGALRLFDLASLPRAEAREPHPENGAANGAAHAGHGGQVQLAPETGTRRLWGHNGPIYGLSYAPDARLLYSCGIDGTVRLWVTTMGANLVIWKGHALPVWDVSACPSGHWLASGGADWTARLWCDERVECVRCFAGHQGDVDAITWHPNSHLVASGSSTDRTVRLWDVRSGACARLLRGHEHGVSCVDISPDGSILAAGTHAGAVRVWDLRAAAPLSTLTAHRSSVTALTFSRSGQVLASGSTDCTVAISRPARVCDSLAFAAPLFARCPGAASCGPVPYHTARTHLTRSTPVLYLSFTRSNLLLAGGPRLPLSELVNDPL